FDEDCDGFLWPEEVLEALENVNAKLLNDAHLRYVFRVLEHCDCQADIGIGLRLFSLIAALSQRVASLNDKMKKLITKCDFKTLDCTLERVK
ncbi:Contactin-associated like 5-3, partial [Paramuricea clavata]